MSEGRPCQCNARTVARRSYTQAEWAIWSPNNPPIGLSRDGTVNATGADAGDRWRPRSVPLDLPGYRPNSAAQVQKPGERTEQPIARR